jgi:hypothetical protein
MIPIKHKETNLIYKTKCGITCTDIVTRDLFLEVPVSFIFVFFRAELTARIR